MALSPNYSWAEPDNSSLVKNGAADIRTLGDAIDTSVWNIGFGQAGKNAIINGNFANWARGTSFSSTSSNYTADRWIAYSDATNTVSRQTFTPGTAPVAGYESQYFLRLDKSAGGAFTSMSQRIEDVRTFAGQTITISFWAKASATITLAGGYEQNFGSGGSAAVNSFTINPTLTTSWARYSYTITLPSIAGKTIGTSSYLEILNGRCLTGSAIILDFWGVQVEYGSKATPFDTATGTIQGELSACKRYLPSILVGAGNSLTGYATATTNSYVCAQFDVQARVAPTGLIVGGSSYTLFAGGGGSGTPTAIAFDSAGVNSSLIQVTTTAGSPTLAANNAVALRSTASGSQILFTGCEL
jgi:hypothetical protein